MALSRLLLLGAAAALLAGPALAEVDTYEIDATHSAVGFKIRHLVGKTPGGFNDFSGTIKFDENKPESLQADVEIKVASIDTRNERRDGHLKSADFFDVEKYPTITFKNTKAKKKGDKILLKGDLTMHGKTNPVELEVEFLGIGPHPMKDGAPVIGFEATGEVSREAFGVNNWTDAAGVLGDKVAVSITVEANKK